MILKLGECHSIDDACVRSIIKMYLFQRFFFLDEYIEKNVYLIGVLV